MTIYIASSWKNSHGVQMLTELLRKENHKVISWIENNFNENHNHITKKMDFETWVNSDDSWKSFDFDTNGASKCDLFIYYSPAGKDACVELGIAWAKKIPIVGLFAKGENLGLMRKTVLRWYDRVQDLLFDLKDISTYKRSDFSFLQNP